MSPTIISLIVWSPFLLLALIFGLVFAFKGYKRGAARAGISLAVTALSCVVSVLVAKLVSGLVAGVLAPILTGALSSLGDMSAPEVGKLIHELAAAVSALVLYVPLFIIFASVLKPVLSLVFKKMIPEPKHVANRVGGVAVSVVDAVLLAILVTLPLYGTLSLADGALDAVFDEKPTGTIAMVSAATDPLVVDVAGLPPFSSAYDALLTCKIEGKTFSLSGIVRDGAEIVRDVNSLGNIKEGINKDAAVEVLNGAEKFLKENEFLTDIACGVLSEKLPAVTIPGAGKVELDEYYTGISNSEQLRNDLPAVFDLAEAIVNSGLADALTAKKPDVSKVDAQMLSKAFGNTLNHSSSLATFKSKLLSTVVDSLSKDIIEDGKDEDGSVKALCDAIAAIPTTPYGKTEAEKEGEAVYLLMTGAITSQNKKTNAKGLGMMLEGLARHPGVGVDTVVNATEGLVAGTGTNLSSSLLKKVGDNLRLSVSKSITESTFPNYCDTAIKAANAIGNIVGNKNDSTGGNSGSTGGNSGSTGGNNGNTDGNSGSTGGNNGSTGGNNGNTGGNNGNTGGNSGSTGGNNGSTGGNNGSTSSEPVIKNEDLAGLIVADKESLEAVKDTVSTEVMVDLGITEEQSETFKTVIDATFDAMIKTECTEEESIKEAESLGNILEIVNDITSNPEKADEIVEERTDDIISSCADSNVVKDVVTTLTEGEKSDPLDAFTELSDDSKANVSDKIDSFVSENPESAEALEALKLLLGITG